MNKEHATTNIGQGVISSLYYLTELHTNSEHSYIVASANYRNATYDVTLNATHVLEINMNIINVCRTTTKFHVFLITFFSDLSHLG